MRWRVLVAVAVLIAAAIVVGILFRDRLPEQGAPAPGGRAAERAATSRNAHPPIAAPASRHAGIRSRPFSEGAEPSVEPLPITGRLLVTVVNSDDQPIRGAAVVAFDISDQFARLMSGARTGSDGTVAVDLRERYSHLVVTASGYPPAWVKIERPDRMRVVLAGEITLRGRVAVDGAAPASPITLVACGFSDPSDSWPEPARELANDEGFGRMRLPFETDAQGVFAVRGIARGTNATIEIPDGFEFGDASRATRREMPVVCNGDPLAIDLVGMKQLTGRVVGEPFDPPPSNQWASYVEIEIRYILSRSGSPPITGALRTKPAEPFVIHFSDATLEGAEIQIWSMWGRRLASRQIHEQIKGSKDLGDIVLEKPPDVAFHVKDAAGRPIAGARVLSDGLVSKPTDAEGRTLLGLLPGTRFVISGAPRFKITKVPLPEKLHDAIEVRLEPAVTLMVRVRPEDPAVEMLGLRVTLAFDVDEAGAVGAASHDFQDVRIATPDSDGGRGTHQTNSYAVWPDRDVAVSGFDRGQVVEVRVEDQYQKALLREEIHLGDDDTHVIEMLVRSKPQTVGGTVLDVVGDPVFGARVQVQGALWDLWAPPETDVSGHFEIKGVYGPEILVSVSAPGQLGRTMTIATHAEPITIRLERARQLAVTLTGSTTNRFEGQVTFEAEGGSSYTADRRGERIFWFEAIPNKPGTLRLSGSAGEKATAPIGADETRVAVARPE